MKVVKIFDFVQPYANKQTSFQYNFGRNFKLSFIS